ncbi:V4R domain-containing protein [Gorillibacterium sp. CAU 1737]|uniref:V4R domain-containing protein n=1 Tax=Gorillibacterium sp. CAU 1737 TaxID=3140362 RepID=UPI003261C0FC
MKEKFTYDDMKLITRDKLGNQVPLELFRMIRLIGMHQALPMEGKGTTVTIGRKIGESLPVTSIEDILGFFESFQIGIPSIVSQDENKLRIAVEDCFCKGLPVMEEKMVCDLEGAILEGAINKVSNRKVTVREVKCNVHGDERCEYEARFLS